MFDSPNKVMENARPEEQRTSPRRPLSCRVKVMGPQGQVIDGKSFDLSSGGIGVILNDQLMLGDICTVMFSPFRDGSVKSVTVSAKVAYCMLNSAGFRTGLQFRSVAASTAGIINSLLSGQGFMPKG